MKQGNQSAQETDKMEQEESEHAGKTGYDISCKRKSIYI